MSTITFDNGIGSRGRRHVNVLVVTSPAPLFLLFSGKSIPGVCRVESRAANQNGKWSKDIWTVSLNEGVFGGPFAQDWEVGTFFPSCTWTAAIAHLLHVARFGRDEKLEGEAWEAAAERFIRAEFPKTAARLDQEASEAAQPADVDALVRAQQELASANTELQAAKAEVEKQVQVLEAEEKAATLRAQTKVLRDKLTQHKGQRMSLEELRGLLK